MERHIPSEVKKRLIVNPDEILPCPVCKLIPKPYKIRLNNV